MTPVATSDHNASRPAREKVGVRVYTVRVMASRQDQRRAPKEPKRLVPTGLIDEVLFTGSTGGKSLTVFQSIGLMITGLGVGLGFGALLIVIELHEESTFERNYVFLFIGGAFLLWGVAMLVFGIVGAAKIVRRRRRA